MNGVRTTSGHKFAPFGKGFEKLPKRALKRVGVVDVGSNSIRLVVFDGAARSPAYFYNEKIMAGLGQDMATTGRLNPAGVERGFAALQRFALLAQGMDVASMTCVATAAVREAEDGPAFQQRVERATGLKLHVIEGEEEARLSAQGVLLGWPDATGLVCDIGGNSLELAEVGAGKVGPRTSAPLGPFRLQQVQGGKAGLRKHIRAITSDLAQRMGTHHQRLYLVGGSWRAIARLDMERRRYPMTVLHEYRMTPDDVAKTVEWLAESNLTELRNKLGISTSRMELVPLASQVLAELVTAFAPQELALSSYGIREGLLYEQMSHDLRRRDPLIESARFSERQMARIPGFGKRLYYFLQPIFADQPPEQDRLTKAACLLHDTTWRAHPDYRAEACFDNVTRANLAALSHPERVFLGLALLHRYKNSRANSALTPLFSLLDDDGLRRAETLGKAMRFGAMFTIDDPQEAGTLTYKPQDGCLKLRLTRTGRILMGEVAHARFKSLCSSMGVEPVIC